MPDLCLWKYHENDKQCLFSEVKGPGDRLSEAQENWIDFLSRSGGTLQVEVCRPKQMNVDATNKDKRLKHATKRKTLKSLPD
jgi:fanconi-associated nuclease 1